MKLKICLMAALCLFFRASAQQNTQIKELKLGDTIPDITISNVINYKSNSFRFSDFRGKLVVLDFWATWCGSCVGSMPESVELQNKFNGKLKIILVNTKSTKDSPEKIKTFFNKRREVSSLTSVIMDTTLIKLFPHFFLPHYVWIQDNVVKAIAGDLQLNTENIGKFLAHEKVTYRPEKHLPYDSNKLLFVNGNGGSNAKYYYRSILTPYVDDIGFNLIYHNTDDFLLTGATIINAPVFQILRFVHPEFATFPTGRVIYRVKHPSDYSLDSTSLSFRNRNWFSYETTFPACSRSDAFKLMQQDIDKYFTVKIDSEYRDTSCWVLKRNFKVKPATVTLGTETETNLTHKGYKTLFINNGIVKLLTDAIEMKYREPVIDETQYKQNISLKLPGNIYDIKALQASLEKQGFLLTREKRRVNYIVLTEPGFSK